MIQLRDYQWACLEALFLARQSGESTRLAVQMATGLGKTITFAVAADQHLKANPDEQVVILVHTDELTWQAERKARLMAPTRTVGVVKAGRNETDAQIIVASVPSLAGRLNQLHRVGLIIVDECHHAIAPNYQKIINHYGGNSGLISVYGFTATLARGDGQSLASAWQEVVFTRDISWAVRRGYLINPVGIRVQVPDLTLPSTGKGDFTDSQLGNALADSIAPHRIAEAYLEHAAPGETGVIFTPDVASAHAFAEAFTDAGMKTEVVTGGTPRAERANILARLEAGITQCVANCMVLTEGWDCPRVSVVVIARPTKSVPLFIQMAGRGLRPWLDADAPPREQQRCLLLIVADATTQLTTVADLSDRPLTPVDGKTLTEMEDQWDLGQDIEPDPVHHYAGAVDVAEFDPLIQRSSKVWGYTFNKVPFLRFGKGPDYVFLVRTAGGWQVFHYGRHGSRTGAAKVIPDVPDRELAMTLAEDLAVERGGDIGVMLADKDRAWRKQVPTVQHVSQARRMGVSELQIANILGTKQAGKAGKLSDLMNTMQASRCLDSIVDKIKMKEGAR